MTLTTRLSLFFLAMLALVLAGFSTALYLLASAHLHRQTEERLEAALNTLVAAAEVRRDSVEWEPAERRLSIGPPFADQVAWLVTDDQGRIVDHSKQLGAADLLAEASQSLRDEKRSTKRCDWQGERWQCSQRWIQPANSAGIKNMPVQSKQGDEGQKFPALAITVGVSPEPVQATLSRLAGVLLGLSLGIWLLALFVGRLVCRRALLPVTRMAVTARGIHADDFKCRLPSSGTSDELDELSRAFNDLLDRLQESFQRQRRFTADASHQLRTPLAVMLGQTEVALRRERPAKEYHQVLTAVHQQAGRLRRIVESLLFLARADSEAKVPELEQVDLNDWLPGHLQSWSEHARAADIVPEADNAGSLNVPVQPVLLGELVNILIDNACKFSKPGTPIRVRVCREQHLACIQVKDEGCGIKETDLPHLFTPFFRASEARQRGLEGVGLGLSIARRLAETFGGTLAVTSQVGRGSCFTLRFFSGPTEIKSDGIGAEVILLK